MAKARKALKPDSQAVPQATSSSSVEARQAQASDSRPISDATPEQETGKQSQAEASPQASTQDAGNVPASTPEPSAAELTAARACVRERLQKHAEWPRIVATVREMRGSPELAAMTTEYRERFIWGEMDRLYPPPVEGKSDMRVAFETPLKPDPVSTSDKSGVKGLSDIPPGWPALPANASLAAEVAWVQANRLYVVEELASGGTRVHLDRAHEPAPSRSAIGWLETSIRSYAKFVEVAAKASTGATDDGEQVRREKMQIEEIRGLLAEMAGNPPAPGR